MYCIYSFLFENLCFRVLRDATHLWYNVFKKPQHPGCRFLIFCWNRSLSFAFCLVANQPHDAGTNTSPALQPFLFCKIDNREDTNIHEAIACKYFSNNICTVVEERHHGYFCFGYLSSSTHFDLVKRSGLSFCGHDRDSHAGNCTGLF